jgi:hypothetical protein
MRQGNVDDVFFMRTVTEPVDGVNLRAVKKTKSKDQEMQRRFRKH